MLVPIIIGAVLVCLLVFVFTRQGPGVGKGTGRSIKRGPASHFNIDGVAKKTYQSFDDAQLAAQRQGHRGRSDRHEPAGDRD